jgi:anti-sigma factor RsiW
MSESEFETALRLQAHLDGELPPDEAREMVALLERDAGARALFDELKATRRLLAGNETVVPVPDSREFYWSKIRRELERLESSPARPPHAGRGVLWWLRLAVPVGVALVLVTLVLQGPGLGRRPGPALFAVGDEVETPLEELTSVTFRSESARMTVVWVSDSVIN